MSFADRLIDTWYAPRLTPLAAALWPLSLAFRSMVALRRALYRRGVVRAERLPVPVIVVGNLCVGGTGKTPLSLALAQALAERGRHPGIVSRGYGGTNVAPRAVSSADDPRIVGDEPLLYAQAGWPIWIGRRRRDAARALLAANPLVDVLIADDGLQHYALARTFEIVVVDAARDFGNRMLLPAGPLREPLSRLCEADAVVRLVANDAATASSTDGRQTHMRMAPLPWRNLAHPDTTADFGAMPPGSVHAIAAIGHPERFFALVRAQGIAACFHPFPDHHDFTKDELAFSGARAILMTEKDAVKCRRFADARYWCLPVRARIETALIERVIARLWRSELAEQDTHGSETA